MRCINLRLTYLLTYCSLYGLFFRGQFNDLFVLNVSSESRARSLLPKSIRRVLLNKYPLNCDTLLARVDASRGLLALFCPQTGKAHFPLDTVYCFPTATCLSHLFNFYYKIYKCILTKYFHRLNHTIYRLDCTAWFDQRLNYNLPLFLHKAIFITTTMPLKYAVKDSWLLRN